MRFPDRAAVVELDLAREVRVGRQRKDGELFRGGSESDQRVRVRPRDPHLSVALVRTDVVREILAERLDRKLVHFPRLGLRIEATQLSGAVARHPDDVVGATSSRRGPSNGGRQDVTCPLTGSTRPIMWPKSCDHQTL